MNKWRYFYYPCQFGWHAALRRRNLLMSGVLAILLLIIAIFAEHWLVFFINGYNMKQIAVRIRWISRMPVGFSFAVATLRTRRSNYRLDRRLLWHCNHMYRFHLMGRSSNL